MKLRHGTTSTCLIPSVRFMPHVDFGAITWTNSLTDQSHGNRLGLADLHRRMSVNSQTNGMPVLPFTPFGNDSQRTVFGYSAPKLGVADLPLFIKPLPAKIGPDEVAYLEKKGALTVPSGTLRSEMLRAYIEFVHPYMPLLELREFLMTIDQADGSLGKVSLILFQAVMFAGSAFIDMHYLRAAGYATRKEARKDFFQKTRVSDDFVCDFACFLARPSCTRSSHWRLN